MNLTVNRHKLIAYAIILIGFLVYWTLFRKTNSEISLVGTWKVLQVKGLPENKYQVMVKFSTSEMSMTKTKEEKSPNGSYEVEMTENGGYKKSNRQLEWFRKNDTLVYTFRMEKQKLHLKEISGEREFVMERVR